MSLAPIADPLDKQIGEHGWSEAHAAEAEFQSQKRVRRALEGIGEKSMLPDEVAQEFGNQDTSHCKFVMVMMKNS